jgi:pimeloyl-ACP methyl ester carboxylesterase
MLIEIENTKAYAYTGGQQFDPAKPTIVFVHGAAHDHSVWALQSRYFAHHGANVLAVDLPGHGRSEGPLLASVEAMADWVLRFCDAVGAERLGMVGHSMGSLISLEAAARQPERVASLALLGTAYPMQVSDGLLEAARDDEPEARQMVNVWSHKPAMLLGGNPNPGMWMLGRNLRVMERMAPGVIYNDLAACNAYRGGERASAKVTCPTLLVLGRRDLMTSPRVGQTLGKAIAGSRVVIIEGAGHSMMAEQPDQVLDALVGFIDIR